MTMDFMGTCKLMGAMFIYSRRESNWSNHECTNFWEALGSILLLATCQLLQADPCLTLDVFFSSQLIFWSQTKKSCSPKIFHPPQVSSRNSIFFCFSPPPGHGTGGRFPLQLRQSVRTKPLWSDGPYCCHESTHRQPKRHRQKVDPETGEIVVLPKKT